MLLTLLLGAISLFWIIVLFDAAIGFRKIEALETVQPSNETTLLSVIIAARNEQDSIEKSIRSQLLQQYEHVEWIVVNDRSTDKTGEIIDRIATSDKRVKPLHIRSLPNNWLGKNYALFQGYKKASGDVFLFTDADVIYKQGAFAKAITYLQKTAVDHITIAPKLIGDTFWLKAFIYFFLFGFGYFKRPWKANDDRSQMGMGIGAFNLITRQAYEKLGTHEAIAMRPDDDLQMGLQVKRSGGKQRLLTGMNLIEVRWYPSLTEAIRGLEKNTMAGLFYHYWMVGVAIIGITLTHFTPFLTIFSNQASIRLLSILSLVCMFILYTLTTKKMAGATPIHFIALPITGCIFLFTIVRAAYLTKKQGGIIWRGTYYSLDELRKS
ncbi:glycosyl transferase [Bacillus solimangrovi]|uniref:4,4'-diaponeurosporenoate glycosyltransferase n=1 Tax=Bacillus solimangrovi TaxID=1305675 RepID=A0A1E5LJE6_9BACI|nr:glycosyl transferase [Bacillus solimangrovi]